MTETTLTQTDVEQIAAFIQTKERMIAALNHAIKNAEAPIYAQVLDRLLTCVVYDALPGAINCQKYFPNLYPVAAPQAQEKPEEEKKVESEE